MGEHGFKRALFHRPPETGGGDHRLRVLGGARVDGADGITPARIAAEPKRSASVVEPEGRLFGLHQFLLFRPRAARGRRL
jgi:hypothetical protein